MSCVCAPPIDAEMADWISVGGSNSGCCGNAAHTYGFHRAANQVPASDYSRRRDPKGPDQPVNWNYACAGDFAHNGNPALRYRHARVLARLMRNDPAFSMICEFIGQPWANKPVYYWSRWDGTGVLQRYTGVGHDHWSHISWYRSRADQRPYLWRTTVPSPAPAPKPAPGKPVVHTAFPAFPGYQMHPSGHFDGNVKTWQGQMKRRGWSITVDGMFGPQTTHVCRAFQSEKQLGVDGIIGPKTWNAAWTMPTT